MAINPMQKKARMNFILGVSITAVIAVIIIVFLFIQLKNVNKKYEDATISKPVLMQDVKSGDVLKKEMFAYMEVSKNSVPSGDSVIFGLPIYDEKTGDEVTDEYVAKIDLKANTILTKDMVEISDQKTTADLREQTYNTVILPPDVNTGDYIDIRLMLPDGTDYVVISKKKVTILETSSDSIKINLDEKEILTMSSAIVEAYKIKGSKLYAIKYIEAGNQKSATRTYKPRADVVEMIKSDPNVVDQAAASTYSDLSQQLRTKILDDYYNRGNDEDVVNGMQESIQKSLEERKNYLATLYGVN